ncbi:hypothetical protein BCR37DRAFT_253095 [Protomyces lactucae-debilis]|uniref:Histone deacetylase complex subunit SAP30 Sin3 binding domain-containing protein n=1 Tax=Protomyces lactucae-debilis TaxID=2754530 RepID=A0A1Y2FLI2_PROLT|nr:uncharacterized protein BCR37DRAFT_253095 [Protomyces lactucae-debilis]ORY84852.1 hypothetical protein BCR37DRAFT_253095 [Protomyces lactucae-debilis]
MPPKRVQKEDSRATNGFSAHADKGAADDMPREARAKRGAHYREYQEDANGTLIPLFEVDSLDHAALHKYRKVHHLTLPRHLDSSAGPVAGSGTASPTAAASAMNSSDAMLPASAAGSASLSMLPNRYTRVEKEEALLSAVKRHWQSQQIKENDAIVSFLYSAQNQDRSFKMRFNTG